MHTPRREESGPPGQRRSGMDCALALARSRLGALEPVSTAQRAAASYRPLAGGENGEPSGAFELRFLGRCYRVTYPAGAVETLDSGPPPKEAVALLLLHYLLSADGHPLAERWVAFRELAGGRIYASAFQGRIEPPLVAAFGARPERLAAAARTLGGWPLDLGDLAFALDVLPRLPMAVVLYAGDDEFPPTVNLLFDGAAAHYLPTEDLAVLGGLVTGALLKAAPHEISPRNERKAC